jgi:hypothetical protein
MDPREFQNLSELLSAFASKLGSEIKVMVDKTIQTSTDDLDIAEKVNDSIRENLKITFGGKEL